MPHPARQPVWSGPPNTCTFFSSTTFPTVDSSATTLAAACLLLACLPQQHLVQRYERVNKMVRFFCYYCIIIHFNNLFCIDHVNRTVSGPPVARQPRIRPSGQNVWPSLGYAMWHNNNHWQGHIVSTAVVNKKINWSSFCCFRFSMMGWRHGTCDHFVALSLHEGAFSFHI